MINKNALPLWFIFIQLHPAMKGLSNKTLISRQFKTVSENNPLASSVFYGTVTISGKSPEPHKPCRCLGAGASHEVGGRPPRYAKGKAAASGTREGEQPA